METYLCTRCWQESEVDPANPPEGCPKCGDSKAIPVEVADTVTITLPWHLLRILCIWAEFWAQSHRESEPSMRRVVYEIADRIQMQAMDRSGLTLQSELSELRGQGLRVELHDPKGQIDQ